MDLRPVAEFPGYFAGEDGNIYSTLPWGGRGRSPSEPRRLRPGLDLWGYRIVAPSREGKSTTKKVATLVCEAFHGPRPSGMEVCHGPGGYQDDHPQNLSWGTKSKNNGPDKVRDGQSNRGERCAANKLTEEQVWWVCSRHGKNTERTIAKELGVGQVTVHHILAGDTWSWLTGRKRVAQT